jgi:UDP-N-acetylglucosamine 1-carboxyvinyltransferase
MDSIIINGGQPLKGSIKVSGNKNAVLPMIAASLLTDEEVILHNVPNIIDVEVMLIIARNLGAEVDFTGNTVRIKSSDIKTTEIPHDLSSRIRTSLLFASPLLARCGQASLWPPGGDVIGRRRLDGHFYGLSSLGAEIDSSDVPFRMTSRKRFKGKDLFLDEASVTATEQLLIAATVAEGETIIRNAASEPHVTDLIELLTKMGADISGGGSNTIYIRGVDKLHGAEHNVVSDHIEAGSYIALAAATGGELAINGIVSRHFWMTRRVFERLGLHFELEPERIFIPGDQRMVIKKDFGNSIPVISDGPWPQFPSDMMSCTIVAASQAEGTVLFFEKMFESRMYFVDRLISMGANIIVCDPHRAVISGPAQLRGTTLSSPDIRAGMAIIIAGLCAKGRSIIMNTGMIARGYENIVSKLQSIGAHIEEG